MFVTFLILTKLFLLVNICLANSHEVSSELSAPNFYRKYVNPGQPVQVKNLLRKMGSQNQLSLKMESLKETALAAITVVDGEVLCNLFEKQREFKESLHFNFKTR